MNPPTAEMLCQRGLELLEAGEPAQAADAFRAAINVGGTDATVVEAHHGLVRALRDAGQLEQSVGAALALTALTPADPLAHTTLSISLQHAGHVPEAETAAARARVLEWKIQLQTPEDAAHESESLPVLPPPAKTGQP
jgi:Flp pilus assembly protein TadD